MTDQHPNIVNLKLEEVVPGRLELPTSTLSVWRSNQLSYRTVIAIRIALANFLVLMKNSVGRQEARRKDERYRVNNNVTGKASLQKGGVPAAPSGTATLLRLSPNYQFRPRPILAVTDFRRPRLSWLDGRCVQGPGTYSPRHG